MITSNLTIGGDIAGAAMTSTAQRSAASAIRHQPPLPGAKAGTLSTYTGPTAGTLTLGEAHGITTAAVIDLYWDGGRRYGVVVGEVSGTSVPISGGAGDNLPVQDTAITAQVKQVIDTDFLGDLIEAIGVRCTARGRIEFYDDTTLELGLDLTAGEAWFWLSGGTAANPLASKSITSIKVTQATVNEAALHFGALYNGLLGGGA